MGSSWPTVSTSDASTYVTITSVVSLGAKVGSAKIRFPSLYIARAVRSLILASPAIILLCQAQRAKIAEFLSLNRTNICYGTRRHQGRRTPRDSAQVRESDHSLSLVRSRQDRLPSESRLPRFPQGIPLG